MTPSGILSEAAFILERDGWCQGDMHDDDGGKCAIGAISQVVYGDPYGGPSTVVEGRSADFCAAVEPLREHLRGAGLHKQLPHVVDWNDELDPETGKQTVIDTFRLVADQLEPF